MGLYLTVTFSYTKPLDVVTSGLLMLFMEIGVTFQFDLLFSSTAFQAHRPCYIYPCSAAIRTRSDILCTLSLS